MSVWCGGGVEELNCSFYQSSKFASTVCEAHRRGPMMVWIRRFGRPGIRGCAQIAEVEIAVAVAVAITKSPNTALHRKMRSTAQ